jgi:KTSC domain
MAKERRNPGLGPIGRTRAATGLGAQTQEGSAYERAMFGGPTQNNKKFGSSDWEYPDSTRVLAFQYDHDEQQLRVRFLKYNTPWRYLNVPVAVFQAFASAPSKGKYVNSTLNYFPNGRATPQEDSQYFQGV